MKKLGIVLAIFIATGVAVVANSAAPAENNVVYNGDVGTQRVTIKRIKLEGHYYYIATSFDMQKGGCSLIHSEVCPCKRK